MFEKLTAKAHERYREARLRETRYLMSFNILKVNGKLVVLLSLFVALNFFDILTTLLAIRVSPTFVELNPIASRLFQHDFGGFAAALSLKYIPILPLAYATYVKDSGERPVAYRVVKVSALIALAAADIFYLVVVGSNVTTLANFFLSVN